MEGETELEGAKPMGGEKPTFEVCFSKETSFEFPGTGFPCSAGVADTT